MQPSKYHQLLLQQIRETYGDNPDIPEPLQKLLQQVSDSYGKYDIDREQLDATVRFRTEQLITSTSRAYSFLDSLNMGFIMCDVNPEVVLTNISIRRILSLGTPGADENHPPKMTDEWTLSAIDTLLQPDIQLKDLVVNSLATNQPKECKEVNFGKRVLRLFIAPMVNEVSKGDMQQIGVVILIEDITEQKVLERSKDEFFFIASHELRTPLTAIRGSASVIKQYYGDKLPNNDVVEMIDDIHESAIRLIEIVSDFLDVSALEQGKIIMTPETLNLGELIGEVEHELKNLCDAKSIALVSDQSIPTTPIVFADKKRIKQVIINLVGNALKFTNTGSITISTRYDDNFVQVVVTDTGTGMSEENQRLLFRKFQQAGSSLLTRDSTRGTGLGLYISKLIVELSGGRIGLESSVIGKGSSFVFSLPRSKS